MKNDFMKLIRRFEQITGEGYIKGISNNLINSAGLTFEHLLGKKADSLFFPDYEGIEIKTTQRFSRYPIGLFSSSFDGPDFFEADSLLNKYGKQDDTYQTKKTLMTSLSLNKVSKHGDYYFSLGIDKEKEYIYINVYNENMVLIDKRGYINFSTLKEKLLTKLQKLCLIYASKKKIGENLYFRYYKIECYVLKEFRYFLKALEDNIIKISLLLRISRSGEQAGKTKNKNLVFYIGKNDMSYLFDKVYDYEN